MEPNVEILGIIIVILLILFCVITPLIIFLVVRFIARRGVKTAARLNPDTIQQTVMRGLEKLDDRLPNDPREAERWSTIDPVTPSAAPRQAISDFDFEPASGDDIPPSSETEAPVLHCSACGAPMKAGEKQCAYCGHDR